MKYTLGDITVKHWNDWDRVPRMPEAFVAAATAIGFTGTAATVVGYLAYTAVTSWALNALAPKPDFGSLSSNGILVNAKDAVSPADFVYGEVRKGGVISYYESTGEENRYLHQIIVLAAHEVDQIPFVYLNDQIVNMDTSGLVTNDEWKDADGNSKVRIFRHTGNQTSVNDEFHFGYGNNLANTLIAESELTGADALDTNFVGKGLAYIYVRYEYDQDVFANGLPLVTGYVKGKKVHDPRTGSTAYSNNAALCIRDFLTASYGLNDNAIDDVAFSAAANECDEQVLLFNLGGSNIYEDRYTINGIVRADRDVGSVLGDMMAACAGTLFWGTGYWKLKAGAYSAPVKALTLDDLRSSISLDTRITLRDNFNQVQGTFNDAAQSYITADYPRVLASTQAGGFVVGQPYTILELGTTDFTAIGASSNTVGVTFTATGSGSGTGTASLFIGEDGGEDIALDLQLPFTTSAATAQRLAKLTLFRGREQMTITAEFGMNAFDIEVGDIIAFTNDRYGWDEKEFEVIGWRLAANQDAGDLRVALTLRETSAAAFDWNAEESEIVANNTNLPANTVGLNVNNLSATLGDNIQQKDGTFVHSAILTWAQVDNVFANNYEVQWKVSTASSYSSTLTTNNAIEISPLVSTYTYTFRVRAITSNGYRGPWTSINLDIDGDIDAPLLPTGATAVGGYTYIDLNWTRPADADFQYIEIWENDSNTTSGAVKVGVSAGDGFTRFNLGTAVTKYYFLKSVDFSGNVSDFTTGSNWVSSVNYATTGYLGDDFEDGVINLFLDQGLGAIPSGSSFPVTPSNGDLFFLTTDGQLYEYVSANTRWELKVQSGSIVASDKIVANTITGGLLATSGVITNTAQIGNSVIENANIKNLEVDAAKIAGNAISNVYSGLISGGAQYGQGFSANNSVSSLTRGTGSRGFFYYDPPVSPSQWQKGGYGFSYTIPSDGYANEIITVSPFAMDPTTVSSSVEFTVALLFMNTAETLLYGYIPLVSYDYGSTARTYQVLDSWTDEVIGGQTHLYRLADYIPAGTTCRIELGVWIEGTNSGDSLILYNVQDGPYAIISRIHQLRR
jgi:hypothetical protein